MSLGLAIVGIWGSLFIWPLLVKHMEGPVGALLTMHVAAVFFATFIVCVWMGRTP